MSDDDDKWTALAKTVDGESELDREAFGAVVGKAVAQLVAAMDRQTKQIERVADALNEVRP